MTDLPPLLDRPRLISELAERLRSATRVGLDCEGASFHRYGDPLALVQLTADFGDRTEDALVDPIEARDAMGPLLEVLESSRLVLHGADYDLRLLGLAHGFRVRRELFDTMIAARYLGFDAISLAALVESRFGVQLEKDHQRADWTRRPLPEELRRYAILDTRYLPGLGNWLADELDSLGRREWHRQACQRLAEVEPEPRTIDLERDWRVKGSGSLRPRGLAVLRAAWLWREEEAKRADRAPFRIAANTALVRLAADVLEVGPIKALEDWRGAGRGSRRRRLEAAIREALSLAPSQLPPRRLPPSAGPVRLDAEQEQRLSSLRQRRDELAAELRLDPSILAPKASLVWLAVDPRREKDATEGSGLLRWQADLLLG